MPYATKRASARESRGAPRRTHAWGRRIVVDGAEYRWQTSGSQAVIRGLPGGYHTVAADTLSGLDEPTDLLDCDEPTMITPFDVARWIRRARATE